MYGDVGVLFEARLHFLSGPAASFLSAHTAARSLSGVATWKIDYLPMHCRKYKLLSDSIDLMKRCTRLFFLTLNKEEVANINY
jgi:hypothetical protein